MTPPKRGARHETIVWTTEREGFEPSVQLPAHRISSAAPSATRTPLHDLQKPVSPLHVLPGILARYRRRVKPSTRRRPPRVRIRHVFGGSMSALGRLRLFRIDCRIRDALETGALERAMR